MKLTRQQTMLAVVLAVALSALAFDQLVLGGGGEPESAEAGTTTPEPSPADRDDTPASDDAVVDEGGDRPVAEATLPQRLAITSRLEALEPVAPASPVDGWRDAFRPPVSWLPGPNGAAGQQPDVLSPAEFRARHKLTAIVDGEGARVVLINGRTYQVGQSVLGYRLVKITRTSAIFRGPGAYVELKVHADVR